MKKIKKFEGFNRHLRIFILISITLFVLVGAMHINILFQGLHVTVGDTVLPQSTSYFALFGAAWMVVMGVYYYLALAPEKK